MTRELFRHSLRRKISAGSEELARCESFRYWKCGGIAVFYYPPQRQWTLKTETVRNGKIIPRTAAYFLIRAIQEMKDKE